MRLLLWLALALALLSVRCHAQSKDLPEAARHEIARRGNHAVQTGTVRAGLIEAAMATPADDSGKWFVTLVGKPGEANFERMKSMIETDQDVRAWIDARNSQASWSIYHVRSIDDDGQRDWIAGMKPAIEKYGLPVVAVQPPRNGQFGKPDVLVKCVHGVLAGKDLANKLREGIQTYVQTMEPIQIGFSQHVAVAPPFNVQPPPVAPAQPSPAVDWPPSLPQTLTIDQIQAACPGASPEFVYGCLTSKETNVEILKLKWMFQQQREAKEREAENPSLPASRPIETLVLMGIVAVMGLMMITILVMGFLVLRQKSGANAAGIGMMTRTTSYPNQSIANEQSSAVPTWRPPASTGNASGPNG